MKFVVFIIYFDVMLYICVYLYVVWKYIFKIIMFLIVVYKEVYLF